MTDTFDDFYAIIPAGGAGTRLWPLSRAGHPKFLLDLDGSGRTLIQQTFDRLSNLIDPDRIYVVTGQAHADVVREQLGQSRHLLIEPSPRNSMPAIGWAAAVIAQRNPDAVIGSFAADHVIRGEDNFADAIGQAVATARTGLVTTVGIAPIGPATAFGYIRGGEPLNISGAPSALSVDAFVEKPDAVTAQGYLDDGHYTWNAGMFVTRASVLLDHLARLQPTLHDGVIRIAAQPDELASVWPTLPSIAIDHAIAEPISVEGQMAVVSAQFGWDDIGDTAALRTLRDSDESAVFIDADGLAVATDGTTIAVLGIQNAVVIRTGDATLVTTSDYAQRVGEIPAALKADDRSELT